MDKAPKFECPVCGHIVKCEIHHINEYEMSLQDGYKYICMGGFYDFTVESLEAFRDIPLRSNYHEPFEMIRIQ